MPDSRVTSPCGNNASPTITLTTATAAVQTKANATIDAYFTASRRVRETGTTSRLRSVPVLASPATASPDVMATDSGRKKPQQRGERGEDQEQPVVGDLAQERRAVVAAGRGDPHRGADEHREGAQHSHQRDVASPQQYEPQLGPQEAQRQGGQ